MKVGRLLEILEEQAKPTFSVFIAGGIDAVFYVLGVGVLLNILGFLDVSKSDVQYTLY